MAKGPRILLWDIESTNLDANFGYVICIGYKWLGEEKAHLIKNRSFPQFKKDPTDDSAVCTEFAKVLAEADLQVFHYGSRFDYPFIQTRLLEHGLTPLPDVPHIDTWRVCRDRLKLNSNRLDTISRVIPIKDGKRALKTPVTAIHWRRAAAGQVDAIKYIEEHCHWDIVVLEQVYMYIRPFIKSHPNLRKLSEPKTEACPVCGSKEYQRRGFHANLRGRKLKCQCTSCFHWFSLPEKFA